jgi:hypothetical protein
MLSMLILGIKPVPTRGNGFPHRTLVPRMRSESSPTAVMEPIPFQQQTKMASLKAFEAPRGVDIGKSQSIVNDIVFILRSCSIESHPRRRQNGSHIAFGASGNT